MNAEKFGAYIHAIPDAISASDIFYVGKGSRRRMRSMSSRSVEHKQITEMHGADSILAGFIPCSSQAIAFALEIGLIKAAQRSGANLVNKTRGGGGTTGHVMSVEARNKIAASKVGDRNPMRRPEVAAKMAANSRANDPAVKARVKESRSLPAVMLKTSLVQKQSWGDEGVRARRIAGMNTPEAKRRQSARFAAHNPSSTPHGRALRGQESKSRWRSSGYRGRLSAALKNAWSESRRSNLSENNPSHKAEVNAKKSQAMSGYVWPIEKCSHCDVIGAANIMKRWHFEKCKMAGGTHGSVS